MASQSRPLLMTGAALASAATLVVATPAIAPSLNQAAITVANGGYNLATFSDILTIPPSGWVGSYFYGWGGAVGPSNPLPLEPWASSCDGNCYIAGWSGVAYLALDALINGNGEGVENEADWSVSAVNYFFEGGTPGAGIEYILQESIGAANPVLGVLITLIFAGPQLLTVVYDNAIQLLSEAALNLPVIGDYVYGALNAYLGPASLDPNFNYRYGGYLNSVLAYAFDVLTGVAPPSPTPTAQSAATLAAAPAAAAVAALSSRASAAPVVSADAGTAAAPEVPASSTPDTVETATAPSAPAGTSDSAPDAVPASETEAAADTETEEAAPAVDSPSEAAADAGTETSTDAGTPTGTGTSTDDAAVANPRETAAETGAETSAADNTAKTRKRPIRDAVEKVGKTLGSALKGSKAEAAAGADEADAAS